ncbi:ParB/RepB/Spo0J family partition protein [Aestuariivirga sp.]|uniref:ParB/RepB/Spo0J family partition protein n=1 Tax=Aestuariivirga sp. TaxID=2650926 RepID=UPI0039E6CEFE
MTQAQKRRLGRGLAALIGDDVSEDAVVADVRSLKHVPIDMIKANPLNPRKHFAEEDLETLAKSLREKGLLQPIVVRPATGGMYEIVAGERRWRAAQRASIHDVPVLVRDLDDRETLEIALIENVQRADLNPLEEARAYKQLIDQYGYTQQQLADSIGKSRSHIANTLRLQTLPDSVLTLIETGTLSAGHARTLVATDSPQELAEKIIKLGMTVRQAEDLTRTKTTKGKKGGSAEKDADTRAMEKAIRDALGLNVSLNHKGEGGQLVITYKNFDQLDEVFRRLTRG